LQNTHSGIGLPIFSHGIVAVFNPIIEARSFTLFDTPFSIEAERSYIEGLTSRDIFHVAVRAADAPWNLMTTTPVRFQTSGAGYL
jgi:hypothetical protein